MSDRTGLCRATTTKGEACRRKALDADGLCLVHNGSQDMRELGRKGGRATPKAKRPDVQRETLREFLRREVDPAAVWAAIQSGLASTNERDKLAAAKLLLGELYEPAAEREREQADVANARAEFASLIEAKAARAALSTLVERGVIRPGGGRPFAGVVVFELREAAEWAGEWVPRPVTVTDVACATCGKAGARIVAEGERVDGGPVYCRTCRPAADGGGGLESGANCRASSRAAVRGVGRGGNVAEEVVGVTRETNRGEGGPLLARRSGDGRAGRRRDRPCNRSRVGHDLPHRVRRGLRLDQPL